MAVRDAKRAEAIVAQAFECADSVAAIVAASATHRNFSPRATILHAGDPSSHIYLIIEGHAQAIAITVDGRAVLVQDFHEGELFGEGVVLPGGMQEEDVVAVDTVDASQFRADVFVGLMEKYSSVAMAVSRLVVARLYRTTRRMVESATLSANGRVYAELLRQAKANDGVIRPSPKHADFALLVQSTRETVSRAISILEKKGIIRREGDALTVVAPHRLEEMIS